MVAGAVSGAGRVGSKHVSAAAGRERDAALAGKDRMVAGAAARQAECWGGSRPPRRASSAREAQRWARCGKAQARVASRRPLAPMRAVASGGPRRLPRGWPRQGAHPEPNQACALWHAHAAGPRGALPPLWPTRRACDWACSVGGAAPLPRPRPQQRAGGCAASAACSAPALAAPLWRRSHAAAPCCTQPPSSAPQLIQYCPCRVRLLPPAV